MLIAVDALVVLIERYEAIALENSKKADGKEKKKLELMAEL